MDGPGVVGSLSSRFETLASMWGNIPLAEHRKANKVFRELHGVAMELKRTFEGRAALAELIQSPDSFVAALAATECLSWHSEDALILLRRVAAGTDLFAGSARQTLQSYDAGTLNVDW